jgi:hypothetical protein
MRTFIFYFICLLFISNIKGQSMSIKRDSIDIIKLDKRVMEKYVLSKCIINKNDTIIIVYDKIDNCFDSQIINLGKIYFIDFDGLNISLYNSNVSVVSHFRLRKFVFPYQMEVYKATCKKS